MFSVLLFSGLSQDQVDSLLANAERLEKRTIEGRRQRTSSGARRSSYTDRSRRRNYTGRYCNMNRLTTKAFVELLRTGRLCGRRLSRFRFGLTGWEDTTWSTRQQVAFLKCSGQIYTCEITHLFNIFCMKWSILVYLTYTTLTMCVWFSPPFPYVSYGVQVWHLLAKWKCNMRYS